MPTLQQRFARLVPYIRNSRAGLFGALLGAIVMAATEPMIPALMNRLLDDGFTKGTLPLWQVPVAIIGLFALWPWGSGLFRWSMANKATTRATW